MTPLKSNYGISAAHALSIAILIGITTACSSLPKPPPAKTIELELANFEQLPQWQGANHQAALNAFKQSCAKNIAGQASTLLFKHKPQFSLADLQQRCQLAQRWRGDSRRFFETYFEVYRVSFGHSHKSFYTGYYEPELKASLTKKPGYTIPIYALPDDLITVNLGEFNNGWQGKKLWGRIAGKQLKPYWTREQIINNKIPAHVIAWAADDVDVFFLHIQGSGLLALDNGDKIRVGFAGRNGQPYTAIGKPLIAQGELDAATISMQSIRGWLNNNPAQKQQIMNLNQSYIFFRTLDPSLSGPVGSHGVALTPQHSLAVDPDYWHYGLPLFLSVEHPSAQQEKLNQLLITQDTGSAIKGPLRGDVFWGNGDYAAEMAGNMKSYGMTWVLLPKKH